MFSPLRRCPVFDLFRFCTRRLITFCDSPPDFATTAASSRKIQGPWILESGSNRMSATEGTRQFHGKSQSLLEGCSTEARIEFMNLNRYNLESMLMQRFFISQSFEIYGGVSGLYDYGPPGCSLMRNIIQKWREFFTLRDDISEIQCTEVTPWQVLKTSGHVDKFLDYMIKDKITGEIQRADHFIKKVLTERLEANKKGTGSPNLGVSYPLSEEQIKKYESILNTLDDYDGDQMAKIIKSLNIRSLTTGNEVTEPKEFNLMFETQIGPTMEYKAYLRPETAQSQFMNFKRLYEFNNGKFPFGSACVGKSFRNEISPRQGLLRLREFTMGEIEYFVDPGNYQHSKFSSISGIVVPLLRSSVQMSPNPEIEYKSINDAVESGIIQNQTMGYFIAKIYLFLTTIGIDPRLIRFRQHLKNEMAHYASDCWDAEILSSYGWIECVGCADRAAYDLSVHSEKTSVDLAAREVLKNPIECEEYFLERDPALIGKKFKSDSKSINRIIELHKTPDGWNQSKLQEWHKDLSEKGEIKITDSDNKEFVLTQDMVKIKMGKTVTHIRKYIPNVIEPSFGFDRILYQLLEHSYYIRDEHERRNVLSLKINVAPIKIAIYPLSRDDNLCQIARKIHSDILDLNIEARIDDSGRSIGKRYSRSDEIGTPLGLTVDFETVETEEVTLRERDSMKQVRGKVRENFL